MKATYCTRSLGKVWAVPLVLVLAVLAVIALAVACEEEEEEETATPGATPTAAVTGTATPEASPSAFGPGVTDSEIHLGQHYTMTGTLGAIYKMVSDAQHVYLDYVNEEKGGVCGRKIVLTTYDDQGTEEKALEVVRKLVEEDEVLAIVGSLGPEIAVAEYLTEKAVPNLMVIMMTDKLAGNPEKYRWTTQCTSSLYMEARNFAQYLKDNYPGKTVALLYSNTEEGHDQLRGVMEFVDPNNPVVATEPFEPTAVDIRSQMLKLYESGAEILILQTSMAHTGQALKQCKRMDWHPKVLATYGNADPMLFQYGPLELFEGVVTFHAFKMFDWLDDPAVAEHNRIMQEYRGPAPGVFTILSQVMMEIMVETLNRTCDNLTREGVMAAALSFEHWRSDIMFEGAYVDTSETDHRVLEQGPMQEVVLEDGKPVWKVVGGPYEFAR